MNESMEIVKCKECDDVFEKLLGSGGCKDLVVLEEKTADFKTEKHVPVVSKTDNGIKVVVGSTLHPMAEDHWITMIEVISGNMVMRVNLKPGDKPEAEFPINDVNVKAREYCNKHGLWANK